MKLLPYFCFVIKPTCSSSPMWSYALELLISTMLDWSTGLFHAITARVSSTGLESSVFGTIFCTIGM